MPIEWLVTKALQQYWRFARPLTMGAQGMVINADDHVLLVRHTYRPGWHFPGGGVERRETVETCLIRELREEAGIVVQGHPELIGIFANFRSFPGDHIALFLVRSWTQPDTPKPNREIAEQRFFPMDKLPHDIQAGTKVRIEEFIGGRPPAKMW